MILQPKHAYKFTGEPQFLCVPGCAMPFIVKWSDKNAPTDSTITVIDHLTGKRADEYTNRIIKLIPKKDQPEYTGDLYMVEIGDHKRKDYPEMLLVARQTFIWQTFVDKLTSVEERPNYPYLQKLFDKVDKKIKGKK